MSSDSADVIEISSVSQKKVEANRRNAQRSTGPKTEAGKKRSRYNAVKYGIFSAAALQRFGFGIEDTEEFDELLTRLREDREPVGVLEEVLVDRIAVCLWRLKRVLEFEAGTMQKRYRKAEREMPSEFTSNTDTTSLTWCFLDLRLPEPHEMNLLIRYETTNQRQLAFALTQLERLQRARKGEHIAAPVAVQISTDQ